MVLALKEWSYIVDALGKGLQSIVLRKGGIAEEEFTIKGKRFLLYPTLFHQASRFIKEDWLPRLEEGRFQTGPDLIRLEYYADVADVRVITDWDVLTKLYDQHAWKEEIVQERFYRWQKNVHLLILQVYQLNTPLELQVLPEYDGCKSWISIEDKVTLEGKPVIFEKIRGRYF
jgi:hypothetical protein